jgi:DNA-binding transcriptional ArsR family regulator
VGDATRPSAPPTPDEAVLEALGDPASRQLLLALGTEEHDVHDLVLTTRLPQSSVYRKLKELEAARLIRISRLAFTSEGKKVEVYRSRLREVRVHLGGGVVRVEIVPLEDSGDRLGRMWTQVRGGRK